MMNKLLSLIIILLIHFDSISQNVDFIELAYKEALKAYKKKEVPIGAIVTDNNNILEIVFSGKKSNGQI